MSSSLFSSEPENGSSEEEEEEEEDVLSAVSQGSGWWVFVISEQGDTIKGVQVRAGVCVYVYVQCLIQGGGGGTLGFSSLGKV